MPRYKLPVIGGAYKQRYQDLNAQTCKNLYPVIDKAGAYNVGALNPTPGFKSLGSAGSGVVRQLFDYKNNLYGVIGNKFYSITVDSTALTASFTERGTLNTSEGYVGIAGNNVEELIIVDGSSTAYLFETDTNTFSTIVDADCPGGNTVVHIDGYFILNRPDESAANHCEVGDGGNWVSTSTATAEASPDKLVAVYEHKNQLYLMGSKTIEVWYNNANATGFAFNRYPNALIQRGCGAKASPALLNGNLIWLDERGFVVMNENYNATIVSSEPVSDAIQGYSTIDDAIGFSYSDEGHLFYVLVFPTEKTCWCFDPVTSEWHERTSIDPINPPKLREFVVNCHTYHKGLNIIGSAYDNQIHLMSGDYQDEAGNPIIRERTTQVAHSNRDLVSIASLDLKVEAGRTPLLSGQGSEPSILMQYSKDGGYTWSSELTRSLGKQGQYDKRVRFNRLGSGREWLFRFRMSDPVDMVLIDAYIEATGLPKESSGG